MGESSHIFRFKKFNIINERSAMKVNTDGVLLGAAMTIRPDDRCLLDIGTGTGTIALMAAQRLAEISSCNDCNKSVPSVSERSITINAIDIDEPSASEAAQNFRNSPWADMLHVYNMSLAEFASALPPQHPDSPQSSESVLMNVLVPRSYDLIFSNPPYFEDSLTAPDERKSTARHTSEGLSYREIFDFAKETLAPGGRVALVLPADQENAVCRYARMSGLHLSKILRIRTVPRKSPTRMIVEFSRYRPDAPEDTILTIQNEGQYTQEYLSLTKDFYLFA